MFSSLLFSSIQFGLLYFGETKRGSAFGWGLWKWGMANAEKSREEKEDHFFVVLNGCVAVLLWVTIHIDGDHAQVFPLLDEVYSVHTEASPAAVDV